MQITAVDQYNNLFAVSDIFPQHLVDAVLTTDWLSQPWQRQQGQELWSRRRIDETQLSWIAEWEQHLHQQWPQIEQGIGRRTHGYQGTAWWLDEPDFTCTLHTDGEMPGALQIMWIGALPELGTAFYNYKDADSLRHQFEMKPNTGYIMINTPDSTGYRQLQWHGMLTPVPPGTFRLCSYSWITEQK